MISITPDTLLVEACDHVEQVKRITVRPGAKLSLQMHCHRAEHWIVVKGTAIVTKAEEEIWLTENQSTYIPMGAIALALDHVRAFVLGTLRVRLPLRPARC